MHNKRLKPLSILLIGVLCFCLGIGSGYLFFHTSTDTETLMNKEDDASLRRLISILSKDWYDSTNNDTSIEKRLLSGLVDGLGDKFTEYMTADDNETFTNTIDGDYTGIGVTFIKVKQGMLIVEAFKDMSAYQSGLRDGDIITKINSIDISEKTIDEIHQLLLGEEGTNVVVNYLRNNKETTMKIKRKAFEISLFSDVIDNKVGYIHLNSIGSHTGDYFSEIVKDMYNSKLDTLVIDLRGNGGGYIQGAKTILENFFDKGDVLFKMYKNDGEDTNIISDTDASYSFKHQYILCDSSTASSSEIIIGALKEEKNFTLIGQKTYGKDLIQTEETLPNGDILKYTYSYWTTPQGTNIHKDGFTPDIKAITYDTNDFNVDRFKEKYKYDDVHSSIVFLEMMLDMMGYKPGRTDGYFSKDALTAYQKCLKDEGYTPVNYLDDTHYTYILSAYTKYRNQLKNDPCIQEVYKELGDAS